MCWWALGSQSVPSIIPHCRSRVLGVSAQCPDSRQHSATLAINSGAHATKQLTWMRLGASVARRSWLEKADILNTMPLEDLRAHLARKRDM